MAAAPRTVVAPAVISRVVTLELISSTPPLWSMVVSVQPAPSVRLTSLAGLPALPMRTVSRVATSPGSTAAITRRC